MTASKSAGYTLTNASLSSTDGMALGLSGITIANLAATSDGKTFTVSGWTGTGSLTDTAAGIVTASEECRLHSDQHLADTRRIGMTLGLSGITTANLTDSSSGGNTFNVTGWTGKGTLTATADILADTVAANATLTNTSLARDRAADADLERVHDRQPHRHDRRQHLHGQRLDRDRVAHRQCDHRRHRDGEPRAPASRCPTRRCRRPMACRSA